MKYVNFFKILSLAGVFAFNSLQGMEIPPEPDDLYREMGKSKDPIRLLNILESLREYNDRLIEKLQTSREDDISGESLPATVLNERFGVSGTACLGPFEESRQKAIRLLSEESRLLGYEIAEHQKSIRFQVPLLWSYDSHVPAVIFSPTEDDLAERKARAAATRAAILAVFPWMNMKKS